MVDLPHQDSISLSYYLAELNYVHPFREGNGRSIREFLRLLIEMNGCMANWTAAGAEAFMEAMIESVFDSNSLVPVLENCIAKVNK